MFKAGDVVKIINQTLQFGGAFGEVTETKRRDKTGHTVKVKICQAFSHMAGAFFAEEREKWYKPEELEKHPDYPPAIKADILFKGLYHQIQSYQLPFNPGGDCQYNDCSREAIKRCMINIYGAVCEVDLCGEHAEEFNGHWLENFPWKHKKASV